MNSRNYSPYRSDWNIFEYLPCCPNVNEINLVDVIAATATYSCMRVPAFSSFFRIQVYEMIILLVTQDRSLIPRHAWKYEFSKTNINDKHRLSVLFLSEVISVKLSILFRISSLQEETYVEFTQNDASSIFISFQTFARWRLTKRGLSECLSKVDRYYCTVVFISEKTRKRSNNVCFA